MRGGGHFRGRSSNGLQRKRDALFPQLPERRKMTELLSWAVGHGSRRPCSLQWSAGKRFSSAPPFQNFFLIGMGGPRRRIMAGDIGRRTWSMAVPPAARLLWSPACREPWPSCLPRHTAHKKRRRMASFFVRTEARLEEDGGLWGRDPLFAPEEEVPSPQKNIISEPLRRESALMRGGPPPQKHDPPSLNAGSAASGGAWSDGRRPRPGRPRCPGPSLRRAR